MSENSQKLDYLSSEHFTNTIHKMYPDLSNQELQDLANHILFAISERLNNGEKLGFIRPSDDGTAEITIINIDVSAKEQATHKIS